MKQLATEFETPQNDEEQLVLEWRIGQLERLGVSRLKAAIFAEFVDWHAIAALIERGCAPNVAIDIVR
jgi:hypothetical protein